MNEESVFCPKIITSNNCTSIKQLPAKNSAGANPEKENINIKREGVLLRHPLSNNFKI
jgi:hypothetical protein